MGREEFIVIRKDLSGRLPANPTATVEVTHVGTGFVSVRTAPTERTAIMLALGDLEAKLKPTPSTETE